MAITMITFHSGLIDLCYILVAYTHISYGVGQWQAYKRTQNEAACRICNLMAVLELLDGGKYIYV